MTTNRFNQLRPLTKRVFIARDALAQLKIGKYNANRGMDFTAILPPNTYDSQFDSAQEAIKRASQCTVCAKGALICSYVRNFNSLSVAYVERGGRDNTLKSLFGNSLWGTVEALFEGWSFDKYGDSDHNESWDRKYNTKHKKYSMESLLKNIIRNKGKLNYNGILIG